MNIARTIKAFIALTILALLPGTAPAETHAYIGTYTQGESQGIYRATLDPVSGGLSQPVLVAEIENPSFLVIHPNGEFLYAVSEVSSFEDKEQGAVAAYRISPNGTLSLLNQRGTGGPGACHLTIDDKGECLIVTNYGGGSVISYPLDDSGKIGTAGSFIQHEGQSVDPRRQTGPHAHSVNIDPSGKRAYVADLGLDKIQIYHLDGPAGKIHLNDPPFLKVPGGSGPRHMSFHPSGRFAYVNFEMTMEIAALRHDVRDGELDILETHSTVADEPGDKKGSTAETLVHPSGKWVYVSNRGPNSIAAFEINPESGKLTFIEREPTQGEIPRGFGIDPTGNFLVVGNQRTHNIIVLRINQETGTLEPTGNSIEVANPVNIRFLNR